jgi:hypothetical protein
VVLLTAGFLPKQVQQLAASAAAAASCLPSRCSSYLPVLVAMSQQMLLPVSWSDGRAGSCGWAVGICLWMCIALLEVK